MEGKMAYKEIKKEKIYRLINTGALTLISTLSKDKKPDIAPIAWVCPAELDPARLLICVSAGHKTFKNIKETKMFAACIPHIKQLKLVNQTGSVSGKKADKFAELRIKAFAAKKTGCMIPYGVIGYVECRVKFIKNIEGTAIVVGQALYAAADPKGFDGSRLLAEKSGGKAIHHLGKNIFITYGKLRKG
jgi:flavin reductase (DIM6/NTAB) family NADH-FMN oxidoreductase RutF